MRVSHGRVLDHRSTRLILVLAGPVLAIGLLLVQIRSAPESRPWGDTAITSINTARAARGDLAEGAYSRFHWNHPGPLLYQVLAPLYALSGQREISIKWTVLLINIGALAGLLSVVARRAPLLSISIGMALVPFLFREQRLLFWAWSSSSIVVVGRPVLDEPIRSALTRRQAKPPSRSATKDPCQRLKAGNMARWCVFSCLQNPFARSWPDVAPASYGR